MDWACSERASLYRLWKWKLSNTRLFSTNPDLRLRVPQARRELVREVGSVLADGAPAGPRS